VCLHLNGVADSAKSFLIALLSQQTARPILLVTENLKRHEQCLDELETYSLHTENLPSLLSFPNPETLPHEDILPPLDIATERMKTLCALLPTGGAGVPPVLVVTTIQSLLQKTFSPSSLQNHLTTLRVGEQLDPQQFIARLESLGYDAEYRVSARGQLAQRGGIVDLWSPDADAPLRIEFFGDLIESLRPFDPNTQQSNEKIESALILPVGEIGLLKKLLEKRSSRREEADFKTTPQDSSLLTSAVTRPLASLLDFLPPITLIIFDEPADLQNAAANYAQRIPENDRFYISWEETLARIQVSRTFTTIQLSEGDDLAGETHASHPVQESCHSERSEESPSAPRETLRSAQGDSHEEVASLGIKSLDAHARIFARPPSPELATQARKEFFSQIKRWCERGYAVFAFCPTQGELTRFHELLAEFGMSDYASVAALLRSADSADTALLRSAATTPPRTQTPKPSPLPSSHPSIFPLLGSLTNGFVWESARLVVITDTEIFSRSRQFRPRRTRIEQARKSSVAIADFTELEEGDFVVHVQHGIGRYRGLKTIEVARVKQEVLAIEYADEARLYVPIDQAHLVAKYVGAGKRLPELSALGGKRWSRQKADAERAVLDLASEMLEIQAARETQRGHAFPPDTSWQRDFEASFIYDETPDQLQAINETKRDLESARPMDRLICGDVGYGKTEVAIRAAFKAVMDNKQVAILVPTTVLAEQHWNTFRDRMAGYPVVVEMLSRFRTRAEQNAIIKRLAEGTVDIVIGTHRLLQDDIHFKDLGLVIIDEEQRFGVLHKEKLKGLRTGTRWGAHAPSRADSRASRESSASPNATDEASVATREARVRPKPVDVLTLTATPIPRTLHLALTGARDMSQIQTAPQDRLPVKTIVAQYDEKTVVDAIRRELARGGQVYYLHNRVQSIEAVAARLDELLNGSMGEWEKKKNGATGGSPVNSGVAALLRSEVSAATAVHRSAATTQSTIHNPKSKIRIAIGHGQMSADELEDVMRRFVDGEVDVLVCTTIIESGLDIPNANTIIIDRADRFGLADLYQLRGRVGRYKHQAYAYILLPRHIHLVEAARKRIAAIRQYSSLGSGFRIAMRDLEIRGAGNILGAEQSGHITAIGFDLYCQLLRETVARLKGNPIKRLPHVEMRLDFLDLAVERSEPQRAQRRTKRGEWDQQAANHANDANVTEHSRSSRHSRQNAAPQVSGFRPQPSKKTWLELDGLRDLTPCYIPYNYIGETPLRIEIYRKLAQAVSADEINQLRRELRDRFGAPPPPVNLLLEVAALRIAAAQAGIDSVETDGDKLKLQTRGIYFQPDGKFPRVKATTAIGKVREIQKLLKRFA
jgi:transcription-repair coupling factor (superfamily II helicase)